MQDNPRSPSAIHADILQQALDRRTERLTEIEDLLKKIFRPEPEDCDPTENLMATIILPVKYVKLANKFIDMDW